jgi:hypothetical protein
LDLYLLQLRLTVPLDLFNHLGRLPVKKLNLLLQVLFSLLGSSEVLFELLSDALCAQFRLTKGRDENILCVVESLFYYFESLKQGERNVVPAVGTQLSVDEGEWQH